MSAIDTNMFLTFKLGTQRYAIEITKMREVLTYPEITEVPENKPWLKGVINLRGEAMPIIDLRIRFKVNENPQYTDKTIVIATKAPNRKYIGYVVDEISDIETIAPNNILSSDAKGSGAIDSRFIKGYIKSDGKMSVILDTEKILTDDEFSEFVNG